MSVLARNKLIRDTVKAMIEPVTPAGVEVVCFKKGEIERGEAVCVFLDEGPVEQGAQVETVTPTLQVMVLTAAATNTDDKLDQLAIPIDGAIAADVELQGRVDQCLLTGWQYERDHESHITALYLTYQIEF